VSVPRGRPLPEPEAEGGAGVEPGAATVAARFLETVPRRTVVLPFGASEVWDVGAGPPVVLLHGIAGSRRVFFRVVPLLARCRRVVVPELRGEARGVGGLSFEDACDDLGTLLDELGLDGATLVGTSFGGAVAMAYGARGDARVRALVLQGAFARFRLRPADRVAAFLGGLIPPRLAAGYFARRVRLGPETPILARHAPGCERLLAHWSAETPPRTLRARIRLIAGADLRDDLRGTRVPVTLARGVLDRVVPKAYFEEMCRARPEARTVLLPEAGHLPMLSHPEDFAALVAPGAEGSRPRGRCES